MIHKGIGSNALCSMAKKGGVVLDIIMVTPLEWELCRVCRGCDLLFWFTIAIILSILSSIGWVFLGKDCVKVVCPVAAGVRDANIKSSALSRRNLLFFALRDLGTVSRSMPKTSLSL